MSERQTFERFYWFHGKIKAGRYPNSRHLSCKFEISERTAHRVIEFLRDRLQAPLEFVRARNGYHYTDDAWEIPSHWINETNILALSLAVRLASTIPDPALKDDLCRMIDHVTMLPDRACLDQVARKVSVKNIEYARVNTDTFRQAVEALFTDRPLRITYHSPHNGNTSARTIQPLHLMHYMGSWHLIAWCGLREELRNFALARIREITPGHERLPVPADLPDIKEYTRRNFGIMQGTEAKKVVLQFSPQIAPWIMEQSWHPEQRTATTPEGALRLEFPAADFRELTGVILGYGGNVKVIEPIDLQKLVQEEIEKMGKIYHGHVTP